MNRILLLATVAACGLVVAPSSGAAVHVAGGYTVTDVGTPTCAPAGAAAWLIRCEFTAFVS